MMDGQPVLVLSGTGCSSSIIKRGCQTEEIWGGEELAWEGEHEDSGVQGRWWQRVILPVRNAGAERVAHHFA
jgi:hypothetical protein